MKIVLLALQARSKLLPVVLIDKDNNNNNKKKIARTIEIFQFLREMSMSSSSETTCGTADANGVTTLSLQ